MVMTKKSIGEWESDMSSDHCNSCKQRFRFIIRRRHHCRQCGGLFCGSCTQGTSVVKELGPVPVRVCRACEVRACGSAFTQLALPGKAEEAKLKPGSPPPALESLRRTSSAYQQTIMASSMSFNSLPNLSITASMVSSASPQQRSLPTVMVFDAVQARSRVMSNMCDSRPETPICASHNAHA